MLSLIAGTCFGLALGWLAYSQQERIDNATLLYCGSAMTVFVISVLMPTATAAGASDMTLWTFVIHAWNFYVGDGLAASLSWGSLAFTAAYVAALLRDRAFEPLEDPSPPETWDQLRARLEAEMKYENPYLD